MINFTEITKALVIQLEEYAGVKNLQPTVERGEFINVDLDRAPWIGVYRGEVIYNPRSLGKHSASFQNVSTIRVVAQEASFDSGHDCEDKLEVLVKQILECIVDDKTIKGTVDMVNNFSIEYLYNETERESVYFQSAVISIPVEVTTG